MHNIGLRKMLLFLVCLCSSANAEKAAEDAGETVQVTQAEEGTTPYSPCHEGAVPGMSCIPGGSFVRGSEQPRTCPQGEVRRIPRKKPNHRPVQTIKVSTFYMDQTEVTFAAYQACAKAGQCRRTRPYYNDYDADEQPMVGMTWYDANQFCKAQGKRLPTEAEWEKAARGPNGDAFPWGDEAADCDRAVIMDPKKGRSCGILKKKPSPWKGKTLPVKSRKPGRYGLYDMIGNAEEWTSDWYSRDWGKCGEDCSRLDPKGPCGEQPPEMKCRGHKRKVVRGGSWYWPTACAKSWTRRPHFPKNRPYHHFGFRCAADWGQAKQLLKEDSR